MTAIRFCASPFRLTATAASRHFGSRAREHDPVRDIGHEPPCVGEDPADPAVLLQLAGEDEADRRSGRVEQEVGRQAEAAERALVAEEVRRLVDVSGLSLTEFASRMGTSVSRLSTYRSGRVTPSAALMTRMRRVSGSQRP
jgi:DNA-binding transcriptional regulator YiaG